MEEISQNRSSKSIGSGFLSVADIFRPEDYDKNLVNKKQVTKIIHMTNETSNYIKMISCNPSFYDDHCYYRNWARMELLYEINKMKITTFVVIF